MVRVYLKGGVWKNSEDEVLKAAVQKYGKQQWARVASLLNKKTAKQAKARWLEWLDPSIRKTEWSRAEDEKLLHLAKLMPAQWKTIAPLVGRTATQCLEHYQELLDQAATAAGDTAEETAANNLRQATFRPGQIDSHPETKPARPDPIDMDEDEMEMLQEARARLANTVGKKAKRKQREKMLAQAKRLADLQKRRELKQAGLMSTQAKRKSTKRKNEIDFGVEIPFYKPAPAGFHSTEQEQRRTAATKDKRQRNVDFKKVNENQYKTRDREAAVAKKREQARMRVLEETTAKYDPDKKKQEKEERRPRGLLHLPEPTLTDTDLTQLAKEQQQQHLEAVGPPGEQPVTQALLGDYTDRPLPTPMRRPPSTATTAKRDLMHEASQLRELERGQTPLLLPTGGGLEPMQQEEEEDEKLPPANDAASVSTFATSRSIRELARQERRAAKKARLDLEAALAALPAPQFEYELAVPEMADEHDPIVVETVVLDQADVEAAQREEWRRQAEEEFKSRSSVAQRADLPRPVVFKPMGVSEVEQEAMLLIKYDAYAHPVVEPKKKKKRKAEEDEPQQNHVEPVELEAIPKKSLDEARSMIQQELEKLMEEKIALVLRDGKAENRQDAQDFLVNETLQSTRMPESFVYTPSNGWKEATSDKDRIASFRWQFETLQEATVLLRKKNEKLQAKLSVVHGGYQKRSTTLLQDIQANVATQQDVDIEEAVYLNLESHEIPGAEARQEALLGEISSLRESEALLQKRYGELLVERRRMKAGRS